MDSGGKRRTFTKSQRLKVLEKTNGRCGYCGVDVTAKFYVDHMIPIRSDLGTNDESNLIATCFACNNFKGGNTVEVFRSELSRQLERAENYSVNFRMAKRFGQVELTPCPIVFYFEKLNQDND